MSQTRMTKQRAIILEALQSTNTHPTADEIYGMVKQKMPHISLGTVYRNLDLLSNSGEIACLTRTGGQRRFDGDITPHRHVRCTICGKVGDIFTPIAMPSVDPHAAEGFVIDGAEIEFTGVCHACSTEDPFSGNPQQ